jgi:hypothetical protein
MGEGIERKESWEVASRLWILRPPVLRSLMWSFYLAVSSARLKLSVPGTRDGRSHNEERNNEAPSEGGYISRSRHIFYSSTTLYTVVWVSFFCSAASLRSSVLAIASLPSFIRTVVLSKLFMPFSPQRLSIEKSSSQPEVGVVSMRSPCRGEGRGGERGQRVGDGKGDEDGDER